MPNNKNPTEAASLPCSVDCLHKQLWSIWQNHQRTMRLSMKGQETSWYETLQF
jgi:hypothetical protein